MEAGPFLKRNGYGSEGGWEERKEGKLWLGKINKMKKKNKRPWDRTKLLELALLFSLSLPVASADRPDMDLLRVFQDL